MALTKTNLANIVEGTLPVANGGTGQTTSTGAANAILPSQTGNTGKYLTTNGTDTSWGTVTSNPGTVTSVAASVPSVFSISGSPITSSGTLAITYSGTALPVANGGTGTSTPAIVAGTGISVSGSFPNQTITNTVSVNSNQLVKAWVNFNGTGTVAIRASYNVSSITRNGTGDYTVNFTNAFADANYAVTASAGPVGTSAATHIADLTIGGSGAGTAPTTTAVRVIAFSIPHNSGADALYANVSCFR